MLPNLYEDDLLAWNVYKEIMNNPNYNRKGSKKYRVFIFIYVFGCIHVDQISLLFDDGGSGSSMNIRNKNMTMLNYLSKENYLIKLDGGYYHLSQKGVQYFADYLIRIELVPDERKKHFVESYHSKVQNKFHAKTCGNIIHTFSKEYSAPFAVEPKYDYNGKRISGLDSFKKEGLMPDGVAVLPKTRETIFLEGDCCTEKISSDLLPKIERYTIMRGEASSIHFFIDWEENISFQNYVDDYNSTLYKIEQLFSFTQQLNNVSESTPQFQKFIKLLTSYKGNNEYLNNLSDAAAKYWGSCNEIESMEQLKLSFIPKFFEFVYGQSKYMSRRNTFQSLLQKNRDFKWMILKGTRYICTPVTECAFFFKYIYIEQYYTPESMQKAIQMYFHNEIKLYSIISVMSVEDPVSGEHYSFRNVYSGIENNKPILIAVENISEDFGGKSRVERLAKSPRMNHLQELSVICLYGREQDVTELRPYFDRINSSSFSSNIFAIHYSKFNVNDI